MEMRWHRGSRVLHKADLQQIPWTQQGWGKHDHGRESQQKEHHPKSKHCTWSGAEDPEGISTVRTLSQD